MDPRARVEALAALPKEWRTSTFYDDGTVKFVDQPFQKSAENHADMQRQKLGRCLICRETGKTVRITNVTVSHIGA